MVQHIAVEKLLEELGPVAIPSLAQPRQSDVEVEQVAPRSDQLATVRQE